MMFNLFCLCLVFCNCHNLRLDEPLVCFLHQRTLYYPSFILVLTTCIFHRPDCLRKWRKSSVQNANTFYYLSVLDQQTNCTIDEALFKMFGQRTNVQRKQKMWACHAQRNLLQIQRKSNLSPQQTRINLSCLWWKTDLPAQFATISLSRLWWWFHLPTSKGQVKVSKLSRRIFLWAWRSKIFLSNLRWKLCLQTSQTKQSMWNMQSPWIS